MDTNYLDAETEFFNGFGWVKLSNYTKGDDVLIYNTDGTTKLEKDVNVALFGLGEVVEIESKKGISLRIGEGQKIVYHRGKVKVEELGKKLDKIKDKSYDTNLVNAFIYDGVGIQMNDIALVEEFKKVLEAQSGEIVIKQWWYMASLNQKGLLKEEVNKRMRKNVYTTADKAKADLIQFIYASTGSKALINKNDYNNQYRVTVAKTDDTRLYNSHEDIKKMKVKVAGIRVPTRMWVSRLKYRITVLGDS